MFSCEGPDYDSEVQSLRDLRDYSDAVAGIACIVVILFAIVHLYGCKRE